MKRKRGDNAATRSSNERSDGDLARRLGSATRNGEGHASACPATPRKNEKISTLADRSAKRKSVRYILHQTGHEGDSDGESGEEQLAQEIMDGEDADEEEAFDDGLGDTDKHLDTGKPANSLSKPKRLRPKIPSKRDRTPSPEPDMPAHEHYFFQNRPGGSKTSDNTFASAALVTHEQYFTTISAWKDPHESELDFLHGLHTRSFDQWIFELVQGFNICLFGFGSKRELLLDFAQHLSWESSETDVLIVNGYDHELTLRDVFTTIASTIPDLCVLGARLGSQPADMLTTILNALSIDPPACPVVLIIHSIDGPALRRLATQSLLARLASSPHIQILASADTPNFPLMWDASLMTDFNWLFHDCTTYQPFSAEVAGGSVGGVVDEVNALLGRSGRKMQGREGVMYVLKSLTQSARGLFALLVAELLSMDEFDGDDGAAGELEDEDADEEDDFEAALTPGKPKASKPKSRTAGGLKAAIEWRSLYQKAVTQFIATNEMSFRGLLKEFHDHEMVVSRKDALGTELLSVPFRKDELETLLEELTGDA